jgi:hypothetical protein
MAVLTFGAVILLWFMVGAEATPPVLPPPPVVPPIQPGPIIGTSPAKSEAWWDSLPDTRLAGTVILLKQVLPQEQALFDGLGDTTETARLAHYQKLTSRFPDLLLNPQARILLGRFAIDSYALEPSEKNVTPLRDWFVGQIPPENAEFPAGYRSEDLERSLWALETGMDVLAHPAIKPDRRKPLAQDLGKAIGLDVERGGPAAELKLKAEKLLALRCYRNLAPTALKSLEGALAAREALVNRVPQHLSANFREKVDLDIAFAGLPAAKTSWTGYSSLLQDCLARKNPATDLDMIELYAGADPETALKLEPLLSGKWKVLKDAKLTQAAKVKVVQKALGIPDPADRRNQFEALAGAAMISAESPANNSRVLLQEAARLAHASTVACALLQKEAGHAKFDEWIAKVPKIDQGGADAPIAKGGKTKQPSGNPATPAGPAGAAIGATPRVFTATLDNSCQRDPYRPGSVCRVYVVALKRGKSYDINMMSNAFDTYLRLENSKKQLLQEDDDGGVGLNAFIPFTAPVDDNYRIIATSFNGGMGPFTLSIQEVQGFGGMAFGGPVFPKGFNPFRRPGFGFPPPGMPGVMPVKDPPVGAEKPSPAKGTEATTSVDAEDLANLHEKHPAKTRVTAFQNIVANLPADLAKNDLAARDAQAIAKYLLAKKTKTELDDVLAKVAAAGKSRALLLALADKVDQPDAEQKASEAIAGALAGQPLQAGKDDTWSLRCRKLLLLQALNLADKQKNSATQAADSIRAQYVEQGLLLGMRDADFKKRSLPAQAIESVIKHLAGKAAKQNPAPEQKEYLDQVPRHLLAAEFVAQDDLELTVMLQRVWLKVLAIHLEQRSPQRAKEIRELQQEVGDGDRTANVLEQLRGGEERILRLWVLAQEPNQEPVAKSK